MSESRSKWAVVTGASSGIGAEFLPLLAEQGFNLVICARRKPRLEAQKQDIEARFGVKVQVIAVDLSGADAVDQILNEFAEAPELLINNAGFGLAGPILDRPASAHLGIIDVNIRALTELALKFGERMSAAGRGQILNIGSVLGFFAVPNLSVYAASKAYVLSFSESLDQELRTRGVRCKVLCPGATASEFYQRAEKPGQEITRPQLLTFSSEAVAREGMKLLNSGRGVRVTGWLYTLLTLTPRWLPRSWMTRLAGRFSPAKQAES